MPSQMFLSALNAHTLPSFAAYHRTADRVRCPGREGAREQVG